MQKKASELDVLEVMFHRGLIDSNSQLERQYHWLRAGLDGEMKMLSLLKDKLYGSPHIIHDLTIEYRGVTQIDILVLWKNYWWVIEVKNYAGLLHIYDKQTILRGKEMTSDPIPAMRNRIRVLSELAKSISPKIKVQGSFILVHNDSEIDNQSNEDFEFVTVNQISRVIYEHSQDRYSYTEYE